MTVTYLKSYVIYSGNASTKQWNIPFSFLDKEDIQVYLLDAYGNKELLSANYSIDAGTHTLVYPLQGEALAVNKRLLIIRRTSPKQTTDFAAQASLDPDILENGYDKSILICQELADELARCIKFPLGYPGSNTERENYVDWVYEKLSAINASADTLSQSAESVAQSLSQAQQAVATASNWATKTDAKVDGEEYSAKYYALQAAQQVTGKADTTLSNVASIDNSSAVATALSGKADADLSNVSSVAAGSAVAVALGNKANAMLSNLTDAGNIYGSGLALPSSTYTDITLGTSGAVYTAAANGYFAVSGTPTANAQFIRMFKTPVSSFAGIEATVTNGINGRTCGFMLPVKKGETVQLDYDMPIGYFRFYYATGSISEA